MIIVHTIINPIDDHGDNHSIHGRFGFLLLLGIRVPLRKTRGPRIPRHAAPKATIASTGDEHVSVGPDHHVGPKNTEEWREKLIQKPGGPGKTRSFMVCGPPWLGVDWNRLSIDWTPSKRRLPRGVIAWRSVRCSLNELCTGEVTKLKTPFHNLVGEDIARNG